MIKLQTPFFSILTASYNRGSTLRDTLESLKQQTFENFEHIVVDGGSNDATLQVLEEFSNKYDLSWISEPDQGIADALNKGLKICTGRYVLVIQADDQLLENDTLEKVYAIVQNENFDVYSFPIIYDSHIRGKVIQAPIRALWWNRYKFIFLHQGAFVHRRVFEKIGGFGEHFSIAMDYDFFYRALNSGCSLKFGNTPVALMGGEGVGSRTNTMFKRLGEERLVQRVNEKNAFWRFTQLVFWLLYFPYKAHLLPKLHERRGGECRYTFREIFEP